MHSTWMRTARSLTKGGVPARWCACPGGVPGQGVYLPGGTCERGVYLPRGGVPAQVVPPCGQNSWDMYCYIIPNQYGYITFKTFGTLGTVHSVRN